MLSLFAPFIVMISGCTALIHQVVWDRLLRLQFGSDNVASTLVTATFMLGLGLGAIIFGRQWRRPFWIYALVEMGIGVFAMLSFSLVSLLGAWLAAVFDISLAEIEGLRLPLIVGTMCLLLPPSILIGGTLPLLFGCFISPKRYRATSIGWLYGANTLGSMLGVVAAPLLLLNRFTLPVTLSLVGAGNIGLAIGLCVLSYFVDQPASGVSTVSIHFNSSTKPVPRPLIMVVAFMSGLVVLVLELSLLRHLFVLRPASPYNFSLLLIPVLTLLAVGSFVFSRLRVESERKIMTRTGLLFLFGGIAVLAGIWGSSALLSKGYYQSIGQTPGYAFAYLIILTIPFCFFGGIFPLLLRLAAPQDTSLPHETGLVYLASALGSFVGALMAHFIAFDMIGNRGVVSLLFIISLIVSFVLFTTAYPTRKRLVTMALGSLLVLLWGIPPTAWRVFIYAQAAVNTPIVQMDSVEGPTGVATIQWNASRILGLLRINGRLFATLPETQPWLLTASHALALPSRQDILLLGLGGGTVLREFVADPGVKRIDVVDWSAELPQLLDLPSVRPFMAGSLRSPKVKLYRADARLAVSLVEADTYDIVFESLSRLRSVGTTHIRSREYYHEVRRILKPSGALVTIGIEADELSVFRAMLTSFRHVYWFPGVSVIASDQAAPIPMDRLEKILEVRRARLRLPDELDLKTFWHRLSPITEAHVASITPVRDEFLVNEYHYDLLQIVLRGLSLR